MRRLWATAPQASPILALALAASLFFGARAALYWIDASRVEREQPVAAWMTPRYIAQSWRVPPGVIIEALGAQRSPERPINLRQLADPRGVQVEAVIAAAEAAIAEFHAENSRGGRIRGND